MLDQIKSARRFAAAPPRDRHRHADAANENFPVASLLLAKSVRRHVVAFYNFVRAADNVADDPKRREDDKLAALARFAEGLNGRATEPSEALALASSAAETGVGIEEAHALLDAFRQDAVKTRYADHGKLVDYCRRSADPVGRYLLRLHGESETAFPASDALCTSLQILNHIQDGQADYRTLDRVYLPLDLLDRHGAEVDALGDSASGPSMRAAFDELLHTVGADLERADALPGQIRSRRLRMEAGAILANARALHRLLLRHDPLAGRVAQSRPAKLATALRGALGAWR
ncbi:squalene/phytoene synthase family protein [Marinivivus vitaminiproducens]|uniref:squalene/phytoene synthase family protein n=1 Tax=Marinivivus vitaminiproducens TaxID=3035935 RepID=UPI0027A8BD22|nr:squalene/phytoene synthase family protein [Geminicoccaceae bacterium SCSIO 64248]